MAEKCVIVIKLQLPAESNPALSVGLWQDVWV